MKCFGSGSTRHVGFHKEYPAQIGRMQKKSGILDGIRKQLTKGYKSSEILASLAFASDESLKTENNETSSESTESIDLRFSQNQNDFAESESDNDFSEQHLKYH